MKTYEITYLTANEEGPEAPALRPILEGEKAKIVAVFAWEGRRKLVYPIKKEDQAFYTTVIFEAEPATIQAIDRAMALNELILRALIVAFVPGIFHRPPEFVREAKEEARGEKKARELEAGPLAEAGRATVEEKGEVPAVAAPAKTPAAEVSASTKTAPTERPKAAPGSRKMKAGAEKSLDEKLQEILEEDIAA